MSTLTSDFSTPSSGYASNVGATARAFLAALFALTPRVASKQEIAANIELAQRSKERGVAELYFQANYYQNLMPGLAAELRTIAQRG